ncbi:hypothetical protein F-liban_489 [Faustovirus]|nr:hypothetical protein F-liban_165 [Faustovirus]QJX71237.1 hypothetical protein F-liban_489 [Faustovirus]
MDILPIETLVEIFGQLPVIGQWLAGRTCHLWHDIMWKWVIHTRKFLVINVMENDLIKYTCESANRNLVIWMNNYMPNVVYYQSCWRLCLKLRLAKTIGVLMKLYRYWSIPWHELCQLDNDGYEVESKPGYIPKGMLTIIADNEITIDWWSMLSNTGLGQPLSNSIKFKYITAYNSGLLLSHKERAGVKLIMARILRENNLSFDEMLMKLVVEKWNSESITILTTVHRGKWTVSLETMYKLTQHGDYYEHCYQLGILPADGVKFMIARCNDYDKLAEIADKCDDWFGLRAVIDRGDKTALKYFNSRRNKLRTHFDSAIKYAENLSDKKLVKMLNGYKNSRFSQLYDFTIGRVSDKRKIFK